LHLARQGLVGLRLGAHRLRPFGPFARRPGHHVIEDVQRRLVATGEQVAFGDEQGVLEFRQSETPDLAFQDLDRSILADDPEPVAPGRTGPPASDQVIARRPSMVTITTLPWRVSSIWTTVPGVMARAACATGSAPRSREQPSAPIRATYPSPGAWRELSTKDAPM
jgi:hypothetical protein